MDDHHPSDQVPALVPEAAPAPQSTPASTGARSNQLSLDELAAAGETTPRTVRYYIAEGLLPGPGARGKAARYGPEHLDRLRLIRRLAERHVPLAEQRQLIGGLPDDTARALLAEEERRASALGDAARTGSPSEYVGALLDRARARRAPTVAEWSRPYAARKAVTPGMLATRALAAPTPTGATWRRWELAPGIELHVRDDVEHARPDVVARLLAAARHATPDDAESPGQLPQARIK